MTEHKTTAIIGAGASGLATARALRKLGHNDVVILESASCVGGKCSTMSYKGRTYELGAAIVTPAYKRVREIMAEHHIPWKLRTSAFFMEPEGHRMSSRFFVPPELSWRQFMRVPGSALRVLMNDVRAQLTRFPRLDAVPTNWYQSCSHWARQHDVEPLLDVLRPWTTSFGYGFMDEVPAAYLLNYMCTMGVSFELHQGGFGGLWQRVAENYDVRLDTKVEKVTRTAAGVEIETSRGNFAVDNVVLACPLEDAARFLDASTEERSLFSEIKYLDYQIIAANTRGMPSPAYVFNGQNFSRKRVGKPMFYYRRYADSGLITFYSYRCEGGFEAAEREVNSLVEGLGGSVTEIVTRRVHRYFPHVSSEAFGRGFYPRLEAMQGQNRTFYGGEVMSFSSVESVVAYGEQLAKRLMGVEQVRPEHLPSSEAANDVGQRRIRKSA